MSIHWNALAAYRLESDTKTDYTKRYADDDETEEEMQRCSMK
jgi:hypothetical protein